MERSGCSTKDARRATFFAPELWRWSRYFSILSRPALGVETSKWLLAFRALMLHPTECPAIARMAVTVCFVEMVLLLKIHV